MICIRTAENSHTNKNKTGPFDSIGMKFLLTLEETYLVRRYSLVKNSITISHRNSMCFCGLLQVEFVHFYKYNVKNAENITEIRKIIPKHMNQICQHRYLITEESVGSSCIYFVKMIIFSIHQHFAFEEQVTEYRKQTRLLWQNVVNERAEAQGLLLASEQDQRLAGCLMSPNTVKFLTQSKTFNKVLKKTGTLVFQHCETSPEGKKEDTFMY